MPRLTQFRLIAIFRLTTLVAGLCVFVKVVDLNKVDVAIISVVIGLLYVPACFRDGPPRLPRAVRVRLIVVFALLIATCVAFWRRAP